MTSNSSQPSLRPKPLDALVAAVVIALAVVTALPLVTLIVRVEDTLLSLSCTPLRTIERSVAEKPQPSCAVKRTV